MFTMIPPDEGEAFPATVCMLVCATGRDEGIHLQATTGRDGREARHGGKGSKSDTRAYQAHMALKTGRRRRLHCNTIIIAMDFSFGFFLSTHGPSVRGQRPARRQDWPSEIRDSSEYRSTGDGMGNGRLSDVEHIPSRASVAKETTYPAPVLQSFNFVRKYTMIIQILLRMQ